jgi:hypothetical protein
MIDINEIIIIVIIMIIILVCILLCFVYFFKFLVVAFSYVLMLTL